MMQAGIVLMFLGAFMVLYGGIAIVMERMTRR